ncbi:MAG: MerR family DNA-binding transcriptional regulator [Caenispirillum bisanense]|uniref:Transcriptional regulator, MerR family n=1 Tax=Caenispirillum bisanense TaxID=414052 RepID=A0A286G132_9PROT|nr:MerR family DNA-binding transcriptional regulator [Caenispirillum bisanense]MCA1940415.1 MerR family DNA-binding transcriptional regulator [Caenispirillum bisanense]MCA1971999.1 MerR family DNA-binding transcriptional regulator [Caenispirillum sp.]SOD89188.1 transcriptional regulator, MerR family [Caenispirillum bisanense]
MTSERTYSISDLSREFDVTARAIRFYEDKNLIEPMREGQRRIYTARDRVRLMLILRGKRLGFSLSEIKDILDLYDTDMGESRQLELLMAKIGERRDALQAHRRDIDLTLAELDDLERQCRSHLRDRAKAG